MWTPPTLCIIPVKPGLPLPEGIMKHLPGLLTRLGGCWGP